MNLRLRQLARTLAVPTLVAASLVGISASALAQVAAKVGVRGTITALSADSITVHSNRGTDTIVLLNGETKYRGVTLAKIADIKPGSYIGTAATPQADGTLKALEVTVFPPAMAGTGEGHYAWDLGKDSSMTNGTVGDVVASAGRTITVKYKGGEKKVSVPDDVPVVNLEAGDKSLLAVGTKVVLFGSRDAEGKVTAGFVSAGKNGVTPPM